MVGAFYPAPFADNKTVKQGLLHRGGRLNANSKSVPKLEIAAYGRTYRVDCDDILGTMVVTITSHDGKQISSTTVKPVA